MADAVDAAIALMATPERSIECVTRWRHCMRHGVAAAAATGRSAVRTRARRGG